jgi:hypothetical protein
VSDRAPVDPPDGQRGAVTPRTAVLQALVTLLAIAPIAAAVLLGRRMQIDGWWLLAFAALAVIHLEYRAIMVIQSPFPQGAGWQRVGRWGAGELFFALATACVAVALRTASGWRLAVIAGAALAYAGLACLVLLLLRGARATMLKAVAALMLGPMLWSWFTVSVIQATAWALPWAASRIAGTDRPRATAPGPAAAGRASPEARPVAVTLSGGGYRAAAIHAGVLWALDQAGVAVGVLSTVSGGSITGANYAIGRTPQQFRDRLAAGRPGLPDDLFNFVHFFAGLVVPGWSTGDTYRLHFDRVYFRGRSLADTRGPVLVINATDQSTAHRAAFWPARAGREPLAGLVAASGAFPVAFDPVRLSDGSERLYVDGGVVENLGVDGLGQYLAAEPQAPTPSVLLISDASAEPQSRAATLKSGWLEAATQAMEAQYVSLHERIFAFYTAGGPGAPYDRNSGTPLQQPYRSAAERLWPGRRGPVAIFILSPTSPAERGHFADQPHRIARVAGLSTLAELSPTEVHEAFWAGARLAVAYLAPLCKAAGVTAGCASVQAPPPPAGLEP